MSVAQSLASSEQAIGRQANYASNLVALATLLQLLQIFLFFVIGPEMRYALAGSATCLVAFACLISRPNISSTTHAWFFILSMIFCWVLAVGSGGDFSPANAVQQLAIPLWLIAGLSVDVRQWQKHISAGLGLVAFYAFYLAMTGPTYSVGYVERPANLVDFEGPHLSAYIVGGIFLYYLQDLNKSPILSVKGLISAFVTLLCAYLIIEYHVRTVQILVAVYIVSSLFIKLRISNLVKISATVIFLQLAFLALLIASYYLDFTQFSSGRTSVYAERIDLISARPLATLLFGTGAGTDLVVSSAWWWDAKNSHNDFLSVLYERGLLGFLSLLAVFWSLIFISSKTTPLALAIFSASIISNGLLARPLAFFIYALIVSLSLRDITDDAMNKHTQSFRL